MSLLSVKNVGKSFKAYRSEWHRFANWFGLKIKPAQEHWVLRNINFEIHAGEAIGVIGQNGAGKSTLLKMITGTLQATEGEVKVNGRIAAILELGMGFDPELTGRQNVFHAAGLMGFTSDEIQKALPDIEAFADIGEYFNEPVRIYSSGMQMRVAFSVATAFRPEILIVDEALSVGDAAFQRKCFRRIEEFQAEGTTLLLVSHDVETVKKLCSKAIYIKNGRVETSGETKMVCDEYERGLVSSSQISLPSTTETDDVTALPTIDSELLNTSELSYGGAEALIEEIWLENTEGERANVFYTTSPIKLRYCVKFNTDITKTVFAFMIKTREGIVLQGFDTLENKSLTNRVFKENESVTVSYELINSLAPGAYYVNCGVRQESGEGELFLHRRVDALMFRVTSDSVVYSKSGHMNMPVSFTLSDVNND